MKKIVILDRPEYIGDTKRIKQILLDRGYDVSLSDCEKLWEKYSDSMCAGWMTLDGESDESIYNHVSYYFI